MTARYIYVEINVTVDACLLYPILQLLPTSNSSVKGELDTLLVFNAISRAVYASAANTKNNYHKHGHTNHNTTSTITATTTTTTSSSAPPPISTAVFS